MIISEPLRRMTTSRPGKLVAFADDRADALHTCHNQIIDMTPAAI